MMNLVIKDSGQSASKTCSDRAEFEKNFRSGSYQTSSHVVQGWRQTDGSLWKVNSKMQLDDCVLQLKGTYLITKITFTLDAAGSKTTIETKLEKAYKRDSGNNNQKQKVAS